MIFQPVSCGDTISRQYGGCGFFTFLNTERRGILYDMLSLTRGRHCSAPLRCPNAPVIFDNHCRSTLLRILLGDFDFNYLATSYPVSGAIFFLLYVIFLFFIMNLFILVMFVCFTVVRRDVARIDKPYYLMDLLNKVSQ